MVIISKGRASLEMMMMTAPKNNVLPRSNRPMQHIEHKQLRVHDLLESVLTGPKEPGHSHSDNSVHLD